MSGKTGRRSTGRKPISVRRQSSKTAGAFGEETGEHVVTVDTNRNTDKRAAGSRTSRTGSGR